MERLFNGKGGGVREGAGRPPGYPNKANKQLKEYLNQYTIEAAEGILAIARNPDEPGATRLQAWNMILDRAVGKPTQQVQGDLAVTHQIFRFPKTLSPEEWELEYQQNNKMIEHEAKPSAGQR